MLNQMLVGTFTSICNIALHAAVMVLVIAVARKTGFRKAKNPSIQLGVVMTAVVLVLMTAHTAEAIIWALTYKIVGVVPGDSEFLYFAFVNFTTLGYGDVTPAVNWRLIGPMTAMNGMLLFGWSAAVIFEVLRRATSDFRS